jgi:hypothetical protein
MSITDPEATRQISYIERRLEPQRQWHDNASIRAKAMHYRLSAIQMTAMALVPVINTAPSFGGWLSSGLITSALAACAAIVTGLLSLGKYQETWTRSRRTAAALEMFRTRYEIGAAPFDGKDRDSILVDECEALLSGEMEQWVSVVRTSQSSKMIQHAVDGKRQRKPKSE